MRSTAAAVKPAVCHRRLAALATAAKRLAARLKAHPEALGDQARARLLALADDMIRQLQDAEAVLREAAGGAAGGAPAEVAESPAA